jgi:hypothetical protein
MAAAPRYGTLMFLGASGRTYASLTYYKAPEQMKLYDFSVATGLTDTTNVLFTSDGAQIAGSRLRYANFLNTIATRPVLSLTFRQGSNVGALQAA